MWEALKDDPVATYAALLSTLIALTAAVRWFLDGPQAWVGIINPLEVKSLNSRTLKFVVSNTGKQPILMREVVISAHERRWFSKPVFERRFYHGAPWDPAVESIPNPNGTPNSTVERPKIIKPHEEAHQHVKPFDAYDPGRHWLKIEVYLRHRKTPITGWAAPITASSEGVPKHDQ